MDALTHKRQRQLREIVTFFLNDGKNDPEPEEDAPEDAAGEERDAESKVEDGEDQRQGSGVILIALSFRWGLEETWELRVFSCRLKWHSRALSGS